MGGTGSHACRFKPGIDAVHAVVAFDDLALFRIPLGCSPGAGGNAGFAAHTKFMIHIYDAVFFSAGHCARGAGRHAPGILAVKTGHEDVRSTGYIVDQLRTYLDNLAEPGADRQRFIGFALNFTGMAADAFFGILNQVVFTHSYPPKRWAKPKAKTDHHGIASPLLLASPFYPI
jgi:hypothetical protein